MHTTLDACRFFLFSHHTVYKEAKKNPQNCLLTIINRVMVFLTKYTMTNTIKYDV